MSRGTRRNCGSGDSGGLDELSASERPDFHGKLLEREDKQRPRRAGRSRIVTGSAPQEYPKPEPVVIGQRPAIKQRPIKHVAIKPVATKRRAFELLAIEQELLDLAVGRAVQGGPELDAWKRQANRIDAHAAALGGRVDGDRGGLAQLLEPAGG